MAELYPGGSVTSCQHYWRTYVDKVRWYAVQAFARQEKSLVGDLRLRGVEALLPTYAAIRRRSNRTTAAVELPLFPGYLFVHTSLNHRMRILSTPGVISLVGFGPRPTPVDDSEIDLLVNRIRHFDPVPYPNMQIGDRVRVKSGPLAGAVGVLIRRKNNLRLVISMNLITQSVSVDVDGADIEPLPANSRSILPRVLYVPPKQQAMQ